MSKNIADNLNHGSMAKPMFTGHVPEAVEFGTSSIKNSRS
jgi:hypothetical protein